MKKFEEEDYEDDFDQIINKTHKVILPKLNATQSNMNKTDSMDHLNPWNAA